MLAMSNNVLYYYLDRVGGALPLEGLVGGGRADGAEVAARAPVPAHPELGLTFRENQLTVEYVAAVSR